jgi:hypothetical protein
MSSLKFERRTMGNTVAKWLTTGMLFWQRGTEIIHMCLCKNKKVKLSLCSTNQAPRHEGVWGSGCIDPHFLHLGTSWRWVVNFTHRPLYPRRKSPRYPLERRFGGPQSRSGRSGEEKILDPRLELWPLGRPGRS